MKILRVKIFTPTKDYVEEIKLENNEDSRTAEMIANEVFWDKCWYDYEVVEVTK